MAKTGFDAFEIDVPCPACGHKTKKSLRWLNANREMDCAGCGATVGLDNEELRAGIQRANKALDEFRRKLYRKH